MFILDNFRAMHIINTKYEYAISQAKKKHITIAFNPCALRTSGPESHIPLS